MDTQERYKSANGRPPRFPRAEITGSPDPDIHFPCPGCDAWPCECGGSGWADYLAAFVLPVYFAACVYAVVVAGMKFMGWVTGGQ